MVEFIRYNGNGQDDIIMQPIWEFFYKNVIGQSGTAGTLPFKREVGFTGVGFCGRGEFSL